MKQKKKVERKQKKKVEIEGKKEIIETMSSRGMSIEEIADIIGLTTNEIKEITG